MGAITRKQLNRLALKPRGTLRWVREDDREKIAAFFGSQEAWEKIPDWDGPMPSLDHDQPYIRLSHGYDESKEALEMADLQKAAEFRGGTLVSGVVEGSPATTGEGSMDNPDEGAGDGTGWNGDMNKRLTWRCCQGHTFEMTPHAVLKGGHWCPECISPPWNYNEISEKNGFAAQVLKPSATS